MFEGGFWLFIVEGLAAGAMFVALIWWVVGGTKKRDAERLKNATKIQDNGEIKDTTKPSN
ncbi:MAG: hypothetical protein EAZ30_11235 [Betaproteobacteria bacterium]|nr:MAG: hypothetical protein EAZ30_11235 [Betaproteobacteria bacterium]TAG84629.1 MAG: hypothetical protein EAZ21_00220 [Betaproteobacteria bacterium]